MTAPAPRDQIAVVPDSRPTMHEALCAAVRSGGGTVVEAGDASAMIWADPAAVDRFPAHIDGAPAVRWVQLPYAGIEPFVSHLDHAHLWTCAKGVYARPVAEHVLALALAGLRHVAGYARARSWSGPQGVNLLGATVAIVGAGGIATELMHLLRPFDVTVRIVRRRQEPWEDAEVYPQARLLEAVAGADVVVVACALTRETAHIIDASVLAAMPSHGWLVNVGRGGHVDHDALLAALAANDIGGAALDVTDPEPLPDGHPLWTQPRCIITPHIANTPEMGLPLLAQRVTDNVRRWINGDDLIGPVDVAAGY